MLFISPEIILLHGVVMSIGIPIDFHACMDPMRLHDVFEIFRREFDAAYEAGAVFQLKR